MKRNQITFVNTPKKVAKKIIKEDDNIRVYEYNIDGKVKQIEKKKVRGLDLSFRDLTATNKSMKTIKVTGDTINGEPKKSSVFNVLNTDLIKLPYTVGDEETDFGPDLFYTPSYNFKEVDWEDDEIDLRSDAKKELDLDYIDAAGINSIEDILPQDPSLYFYSYSNEKFDDVRRSALIRRFSFSPYAVLGVYNFSPIFESSKEAGVWYTFGLEHKFIDVYTIQKGMNTYIGNMICRWFGDKIDVTVKSILGSEGLAYYIKQAYKNVDMNIISYGYDNDLSELFRTVVLCSSKLHWYESTVRKPEEKIHFSTTDDAAKSYRYKYLLKNEDTTDMEISIIDRKIGKDYVKGSILKLIGATDFNNLSEENKKRIEYISVLWTFQNKVALTLYKFIELLKKGAGKISIEDFAEGVKQEVVKENTIYNARTETLNVKQAMTEQDYEDLEEIVEAFENEEQNNEENEEQQDEDVDVDEQNIVVPSNPVNDEVKALTTEQVYKMKDYKFDVYIKQATLKQQGKLTLLIKDFDELTKEYRNICDFALAADIASANPFGKEDVVCHPFIYLENKLKGFMYIRINRDVSSEGDKNSIEKDKQSGLDNKDEVKDFMGTILENKITKKTFDKDDGITGRSIVFKYGIFTIILHKLSKGQAYNYKDVFSDVSSDTDRKISDVMFEDVIVLWDKNYLVFSNSKTEGNVWYESYHTFGQGKVKNTDISSACVMIRFRPEMNIKYSYSKDETAMRLPHLHRLFSTAFYIMDHYFSKFNVEMITPQVSSKNLIVTDIGNNVKLEHKLTRESDTNPIYKTFLTRAYEIDEKNELTEYYSEVDGQMVCIEGLESAPAGTVGGFAYEAIVSSVNNDGEHDKIIQDKDYEGIVTDIITKDIRKDDTKHIESEPEDN